MDLGRRRLLRLVFVHESADKDEAEDVDGLYQMGSKLEGVGRRGVNVLHFASCVCACVCVCVCVCVCL